MRKQAFLLGLFSVGGQVFLLRELVATFGGYELLIGTALFGWLIAVAVGAFIGGKKRFRVDVRILFIVGATLVPASMIAIRLSPSLLTDFIREVVPLTKAGLVSILAMLPVGIISGMIFTVISQSGKRAADSVATVYLFEGFGAFVAGLGVTFSIGGSVTSLMLAAFLCIISATGVCIGYGKDRNIFAGVTAIVLSALIIALLPLFEGIIDKLESEPPTTLESFDTHYGRQTIIKGPEHFTLLTNRSFEAYYPHPRTVEEILYPPLIYFPDAKRILLIGRPEIGVGELSWKLDLDLSSVDPRVQLSKYLDPLLPHLYSVKRIDDDPVRYLNRNSFGLEYDIIIMNTASPDSHYDSRYFTERFLVTARNWLKDDGILFVPTKYDTDRHIDRDKKHALSVIYKTLSNVFPEVTYWPGNMTHFFASAKRKLNLSTATIMNRAEGLKVSPHYIHPNYLIDRLEPMKMERLVAAVNEYDEINSLTRPILPHIQTIMNARLDSFDRRLIGFVLGQSWWIIVLPLGILGLLVRLTFRRGRRESYALFLYFIAGLVSLSLELICFYLYQSTAGSLYSEMAILIGVFMLGLSLGTYYALKVGDRPVEFPALLMLVTIVMIFIFTYELVGANVLLLYYSLLLLVTALATGTLFVGATNRYYNVKVRANRGIGYGWELAGSSIGALLTTTVLLPVIGLTWILWSLVILLVLTFVGALWSHNS